MGGVWLTLLLASPHESPFSALNVTSARADPAATICEAATNAPWQLSMAGAPQAVSPHSLASRNDTAHRRAAEAQEKTANTSRLRASVNSTTSGRTTQRPRYTRCQSSRCRALRRQRSCKQSFVLCAFIVTHDTVHRARATVQDTCARSIAAYRATRALSMAGTRRVQHAYSMGKLMLAAAAHTVAVKRTQTRALMFALTTAVRRLLTNSRLRHKVAIARRFAQHTHARSVAGAKVAWRLLRRSALAVGESTRKWANAAAEARYKQDARKARRDNESGRRHWKRQAMPHPAHRGTGQAASQPSTEDTETVTEQRNEIGRILALAEGAHYEVLSVSDRSSAAAIKSAFRRHARLLHPDKCRESNAHDAFLRLQAAQAVLTDPTKRAEYDRERFLHGSQGFSFNLHARAGYADGFSQGFGTAPSAHSHSYARQQAAGVGSHAYHFRSRW